MKTIIVGSAGHQGRQYLRTLRHEMDIVALVDKRPTMVHGDNGPLPWFASLAEARNHVQADCAIVAVPHHEHLSVSTYALQSGLHVIKEKPLSSMLEERDILLNAARSNNRSLLTVAQRAYEKSFRAAIDQLPLIGEPYSFTYEYHASRSRITTGWRADPLMAGGGVLLDMGYHLLDMLDRLFGSPESGSVNLSYCFPELKASRLEDAAAGLLRYERGLSGAVIISRHHGTKYEKLQIQASEGSIVVTPDEFRRYSFDGHLMASISVEGAEKEDDLAVKRMVLDYIDHLEDPAFCADNVARHSRIVEVLDLLYRSAECSPSRSIA
jgi:predicted dehydrogenase